MATGIGQQLKGMMQKARNYWAELTDEESTRTRHRHEDQENAVHQRYGGVRTRGEGAQSFRNRQEQSQDRAPSNTGPTSPADVSRSQDRQYGGQATGGQQMQEPQAQRQYAQQGGSGSQKTLAEQEERQAGTSSPETTRGKQPPAGGQQSH